MEINKSDTQAYRLKSIDDQIDRLIVHRLNRDLNSTNVRTHTINLMLHRKLMSHINGLTRYRTHIISLS
jgi:hypothetical protein